MMIESLKQLASSLFKANPTTSPDKLTTHNPEVQRITQAPLIIVGLIAALLAVGIFTIAYSKAASLQKPAIETAPAPKALSKSDTPDWFAKKQQEGVIGSNETDTLPELPQLPEPADSTGTPSLPQEPAALTPYQAAQLQAWQQQEQQRQHLEETRRATFQNALQADTTVYNNPNSRAIPLASGIQAGIKETAFASDQPEPDNYLLHTRVKAVSPYEVKAGTVIPSVMLGGVNSDLPGQIMAQVAQNVYDTATGNYLLIPQGTKLVGQYDHQVVSGQKRVLVIWNRLIYPDASSVTLAGMPGADPSGYAGFKDKTSTHFWPTFRNALMLSAITAGVQLSQPRAQSGDFSYSSQQMAAGALGQQMAQLGMATVGQGLNQAPTLTIRPGYVFNVMINKDMILPPWHPEAAHL